MAASIPAARTIVVRKRGQGLTVLLHSMANGATPLGLACFYGALIVLLLAPLYPAISGANFTAILSSNFMSGLLGGHITHFTGFPTFLALEVYSSFYGLLFGGFVAWIGGAALPLTMEDGTLDLALSRPISRARYYLASWLAVALCALIIGLVVVCAVWIDTFLVHNSGINWRWLWITQLVQWAFMFFAGGLGMLCGAGFSASRKAGGAALGLIVLGYLLNTIGGLASQFEWLRKLGPLYYAPTIDPLVFHTLTWWYPLVLVAAGLACGVAGLVIFNRRDLPTV